MELRKSTIVTLNALMGTLEFQLSASLYSEFKFSLNQSSQSRHPQQDGTVGFIYFFTFQLKIASKFLKNLSQNT